jgi:hypothetical protein
VTAPSPRPLATSPALAEVDRDDRLRCAHRGECLGIAGRAGWRGLDCGGCGAYQPLTPREIADDAPGLAAIAVAVVRDLARRPVDRRLRRGAP